MRIHKTSTADQREVVVVLADTISYFIALISYFFSEQASKKSSEKTG